MAALSSPPASPRDQELADIAGAAAERDRSPSFPGDALEALGRCGLLGLTVPAGAGAGRAVTWGEEWSAVRTVARADGSVGRIYDGHLNAVERLAALAPEPLRSRELAAVAAGELWLGVWGADPLPDEGEPARLVDGGSSVRGTKVFCSGAGGLHRAAVLVRGPERDGPPLLAYLDLTRGLDVDRTWYRGEGLRASESHRVCFSDTPVLAVLGEPGELSREPLFGRDAMRTAATWAGIADSAAADALALLAARPRTSELEALAAGRIGAARATIDACLGEAAHRADADPEGTLPVESIHLRSAVAGACRAILDEAARACGSRPFATGSALDRARRDLELFLLQHRLDPLLARAGAAAVAARRAGGVQG